MPWPSPSTQKSDSSALISEVSPTRSSFFSVSPIYMLIPTKFLLTLWLPSPPETMETCLYRRSAVVEGVCRLQSKFYITKRNQMKWKHRRFAFANLRCLSGDGEIRTLVQTWNQYAFYMLSFDLVFDRGQDQNYQPKAYLLKSRTATGEQAVPAPILLAPPYRNVSEQGNRVMSRFCHCGRNKANLLCFG